MLDILIQMLITRTCWYFGSYYCVVFNPCSKKWALITRPLGSIVTTNLFLLACWLVSDLYLLFYIQSLKHNPNGRFVVVCGDGEYIIYTALAWRNRSFGSALEFVWSSDGEYAVRESTSKIKIFSKTFQVWTSFRITFILCRWKWWWQPTNS